MEWLELLQQLGQWVFEHAPSFNALAQIYVTLRKETKQKRSKDDKKPHGTQPQDSPSNDADHQK